MIAREVRPSGQGTAVGTRFVERSEHEVEQLTQTVGHDAHLRRSTFLIAFDLLLDGTPVARHGRRMPSWSVFETAAPELGAAVRARLDARAHKTLATVRRDGSPRISGTETVMAEGELWIGSMWRARKTVDLQRDPRFALHGGSDDPPGWSGDAKLAGVAVEITDPERVQAIIGEAPGPSHLFRLDLREVSTVGLDAGRSALVIEVWTPERGVRTIGRS